MQQPPIDISLTQWQTISNILQKHVPQYPVWAFGSRAKWKAKPFSDLDLAIITEQPMDWSISATLVEDFSESNLPFKVDILDWATTNKAFCKMIAADKIILQTGNEKSTP